MDGKLFVVTTDGKAFEQKSQYSTTVSDNPTFVSLWTGKIIPVKNRDEAVGVVKDELKAWMQKGDRLIWYNTDKDDRLGRKPSFAVVVNEVGEQTDAAAMIVYRRSPFKPGETVLYKGERVRVDEHVGDRVAIWIPSRQEQVWVTPDKLQIVNVPQTVPKEQIKQEFCLQYGECNPRSHACIKGIEGMNPRCLDCFAIWRKKHLQQKNPPLTRKNWVKIKDPGQTSFTPGSIIPYEEFERENKKVTERGEKPASIAIRYRYGQGNGQPDNGNGDKSLPATIEGEPIPEKYRELTPLINEPLPPGVDFLPAVVPEEGERKIDTVLRQLQSGVESIQDSSQFRIFLTTMAKFHNYSMGNQILIAIQKPEATKVAGFNTWKDLGRFVRRGEKAISILAPVMPPKPKKEKAEEAEAEEEELTAPQPVYFKVVSVFDISQTEGKPLPEFDVPVLTGAANDKLFAKAITLARNQGLDVTYEPMPQMDPAVMGFYSGKTIWIKPGESDAQQLKTLLHEMAHYYSEGVFRIPRQTAETIAESAAFAVGAHFGFDSGVRSFPYVALWAQDKKVLNANLANIRKVASTMLESLEKIPIQTHVIAQTKPTGACYEDAWRFLRKEKEGHLVHGTVWSEDKRIGHAWVETETGYIWEPETGNFFTKLGFENVAAPIAEAKYDTTEASIMAARSQNFGPWTPEERGKWLKMKEPAVEYLPDSAEFLAQTIVAAGYREKLDDAFQEAIARASK